MKKLYSVLTILAVFVAIAPKTLYAAACSGSSNICNLILVAGDMINLLTGIVAALALLVFFWGVVRYILAAGDEKAKDQGKRTMVGGVIALFVMFSVFGIIFFLRQSFGINNVQNVPPPRVTF
jgi:hypothetical protein